MSAYLNREIVHTGADVTVVPLNRWSQSGNYTIFVEALGGVGTADIQLTLDHVNRGEAGNYDLFEVTDESGTQSTSTGLAVGIYKAVNLPGEAMQFTSTDSMTVRVMQNGSSGG